MSLDSQHVTDATRVTPEQIGWAWDESLTPYENGVAAVEAMPADADRATVSAFLARYVRGMGGSMAEYVIDGADRDITIHPAADFM